MLSVEKAENGAPSRLAHPIMATWAQQVHKYNKKKKNKNKNKNNNNKKKKKKKKK